MGLKSLLWTWGQAQAGTGAQWAFAKSLPTDLPSRWHLRCFPRGPGSDAEVPAKSGELGSRGLGCGLPRAGWAQTSSLEPICLSGRRNPKHPERSLCPAGTGPVACLMHVASGGRERAGGIDLPYSKSSLEETGRACLLDQ